jgi:hypothetical protein
LDAIAINWRQGLKNLVMKRSTFKLVFLQQTQICCHRCNDEKAMADLSRQLITDGNSAVLTLRGDSNGLLVRLELSEDDQLQVRFIEA